MPSKHIAFLILVLAVSVSSAFAQGVGSVPSPVVKPGSSISFSSGFAFGDERDGTAYRVGFRHTISEKFRAGAFIYGNNRGDDFRYRRFEVEGMYQLASSKKGWNSAVRVRGRLPDGNDGAGRLRVSWLNRWRPIERGELRIAGLASKDLGSERREGISLETRAEATWQIRSTIRIGAQVFNRYNTTERIGSFDTQRHSAGGVIKGALTDRLSYRLNALTGVSSAAQDFELRFRISMAL
mgnify:CR=1 FL=1